MIYIYILGKLPCGESLPLVTANKAYDSIVLCHNLTIPFLMKRFKYAYTKYYVENARFDIQKADRITRSALTY